MKNKKLMAIMGAVSVLLVVLVVVLLIFREDDGKVQDVGEGEQDDVVVDTSRAPDPAADLEKLDEVRRLWPDVLEPDTRDPEAVKKEWMAFAKAHPDNFYIPSQFQREMSDQERKTRMENMQTYNV